MKKLFATGFRSACMTLALIGAAGCGAKSDFKTVPVSGILTCDGNPIPNVYVVFSPKPGDGQNASMPGKAGAGKTDESGHFVLSTYDTNDGAVVGKHVVSFMIDETPENPTRDASKKVAAPCLTQTQEVEVKPGMESLTIALGK